MELRWAHLQAYTALATEEIIDTLERFFERAWVLGHHTEIAKFRELADNTIANARRFPFGDLRRFQAACQYLALQQLQPLLRALAHEHDNMWFAVDSKHIERTKEHLTAAQTKLKELAELASQAVALGAAENKGEIVLSRADLLCALGQLQMPLAQALPLVQNARVFLNGHNPHGRRDIILPLLQELERAKMHDSVSLSGIVETLHSYLSAYQQRGCDSRTGSAAERKSFQALIAEAQTKLQPLLSVSRFLSAIEDRG